MRRIHVLLIVVALGVALVAGCSDSDSDPTGNLPAGAGTLTVNIHDTTADDIESAMVTFESLQAIAADGTLHDVAGPMLGQPVDLATLINGNEVTLANDALPMGDYVGLRMTVSAVALTFSNGDPPAQLALPGGLSFQVMTSFSVAEQGDTVITLDVPLGSFQLAGGNWMFDTSAITVDP